MRACISKSNSHSRFIFIYLFFYLLPENAEKNIFKNAEWEKRFLFPRLALTYTTHQYAMTIDDFIPYFFSLHQVKTCRISIYLCEARVAYFPIYFFVTLHPNVWPFFDGVKVFSVILRTQTSHISLSLSLSRGMPFLVKKCIIIIHVCWLFSSSFFCRNKKKITNFFSSIHWKSIFILHFMRLCVSV